MNVRVVYIGPVQDPSLTPKENDFLVFVSPLAKYLHLNNKQYFKPPKECLHNTHREIFLLKNSYYSKTSLQFPATNYRLALDMPM